MNTVTIEQIIKRGHSKELFEAFDNAFDLMDFSCEKTGNNVFHLLAKHGKKEFAEEVLNHYEILSKNAVGLMLIAKNNEGIIPANIKKSEKTTTNSSKKIGLYLRSIQEKEELESVRNILKRKTKQFIHQNENNNALFHIGTRFEQGIPLETRFGASENSFTTQIPVYPSIKLIRYDTSDYDEFGLSSDKKNNLYINFKEEIFSQNQEKKQVNKGEYVDIGNVNMNEDLAFNVSGSLPFPEDFEKNISVLHILGRELSFGFSDDLLAPLYQYFASKGGVFVIEDKNKPYMNSNTIKTSRYAGATVEKKDVFTSGFVRLIYLNAENGKSTDKKDFVNTIRHELTHCADNHFSSCDISSYFFAIQCAKNVEENPLFKTFENIAKNYKCNSFKSEALANVIAHAPNDELSKEFIKLFSNYTKFNLHSKNQIWQDNLSETIRNIPKECRKFLDKADNKLYSTIKHDYSTDYASSFQKEHLQTEIVPIFLDSLKTMNKSLARQIQSFEKNNLLKQDKENNIEEAFVESSVEVMKCQNSTDLQEMLTKQLEDYTKKDTSKLHLLKIAITASTLRKKEFPELQNHENSFSFKNKDNFFALLEDEKSKAKIIRNANKLSKTLFDLNNNEINHFSAKIALYTDMSGKGIEKALNQIDRLMENMSRNEQIDLLKSEIVRNDPVLKGVRSKKNDTLHLLRIAKIAENLSSDNSFKVNNINPAKFNLANKENLFDDAVFKNVISSLIRVEQKPFDKQWACGQNKLQSQLSPPRNNSLSR